MSGPEHAPDVQPQRDVVVTSVETSADGRVVLRKRATGPASGRRLTREATVLDAARHPGVVAVVERTGDGDTTVLDLAWAGARSLSSQPRLPIDEVAGLATSLATTVADLHEIDVVHGRINPAHVLVGFDGRPILCGLADARMPGLDGGCDATKADDVAALGALLTWLIGDGSEVEPIPEHRWWRRSRWDGYHRRSLLNLADHASEPDASTPTSARALADAITRSVPGARLPADRPPADPLAHEPDTATAPAPPWSPAATATTTADAVSTVERAGLQSPTTVGARKLDEPVDTDVGRADDPATPERRRRPVVGRPGPAPGRRRATGQAEPLRPDGSTDRGPAGHSTAFVVPADDIDPAETSRTVRRRWVFGGVAAGALTLSIVAVGALPDRTDGGADHREPTTPDGAVPSTRRGADGAQCPAVVGPRADADGDGCPDLVTVKGRRVHIGSRSFVIGEDGDRIAVGDWDCDGTSTAAVLRPDTGSIYTFAAWPGGRARPSATLAASVEHATDVRARPGRSPQCPLLVIERSGGPARVLDLGPGR